jgi:hypothetical protein
MNGSSTQSTKQKPSTRLLCFGKDDFTSETFDFDKFLLKCRKRANLDSVLEDLKDYGLILDNDLIELINTDYNDFVSLSSKLTGVDKVVLSLKKTLKLFKTEVQV